MNVEIAQTGFSVLRSNCPVRSIETEDQGGIQLRDSVVFSILQSDVEDGSAKPLVGEAVGNIADIRDGQSSVWAIGQTKGNEQSGHYFSVWREEIQFDGLPVPFCAIGGANNDLSVLAVDTK